MGLDFELKLDGQVPPLPPEMKPVGMAHFCGGDLVPAWFANLDSPLRFAVCVEIHSVDGYLVVAPADFFYRENRPMELLPAKLLRPDNGPNDGSIIFHEWPNRKIGFARGYG